MTQLDDPVIGPRSRAAAPPPPVRPDPSQRIRHVALIMDTQVAPRRNMLTGVARYIQEHEPWALYLKPFGVDKSLESWLQHWDGDGIIAAVSDPASFPTSFAFTNRRFPVVDVVGVLSHEHVPLVHTNDRAVGRLGAEHLMERGFRHFGFCEYSGNTAFWSSDRRKGFRETLQRKGFDTAVYLLPLPGGKGGPLTWEQQQRELAAWIEALPKPVGIMTTNDLMGQQFLEACLRLRINVPEEVAVVGADNDEPICRISQPPLSSVIINDHQRGYEAAALLDRMMQGDKPPREPIYIEPAGVSARASTDILAIDDAAVLKALRYLRERACDPISVNDVVRAVPVSRTVLERRFRKVVGRTINNEIIRLRLNRAIELLTQTELEMKQIAHRAGFGSQSYMNAVFQMKLAKTPGSYRRH